MASAGGSHRGAGPTTGHRGRVAASTAEWTRREVTLAIPRNADAIEVSVILTGTGTVWLDDTALDALPAPR